MSYGRRKIYTNEETIMLANIRDVLKKAYNEHQMNRNAITKLWDYYRGKRQSYKRPKRCEKASTTRCAKTVLFPHYQDAQGGINATLV